MKPHEENHTDPSRDGEKHTKEHPYCRHLACGCHTNSRYGLRVTRFSAEKPSAEQMERARRFFGLFGR
jgi:hypothetical protein